MSPKRSRSRSRSRSPHDDRRGYKRRHSPERSSGSRRKENSSRSSSKGSSRSKSPSEKHRTRRSHKSDRRREERSRSYSPVASHKERDSKDKEEPDVCHCLGVFGLSSYTQEKDLRDVFSQYGDIDDICIIYDRQTGQSKGYGFVYFKSTSDAVEARRNTQGLVLDRRPIRVDYSFTVRPHSPTPGRYLGRRSSRDYDRDRQDRHYRDDSDYDDRPSYRDTRDSRDARDGRDARDSRDGRDGRDARDSRDTRRSSYRDWR
ncbi:unnamed protein product [Candidula unifasciata]|uniref:RRM domain-containing protein n=1 Tax=Candidula unifasciata TaxID=100452 RepID=A0A8S3ZWI4_9EUPU|nr:unnamed protein product [Candidula unifasciata]